jgi:DNA-binding transcriptional MerR regulator
MAGMPVATLRIWEQRYQAVRPTTAASGHRLYSAADVERVTLLRRLTEQGHAIGLLAALDSARMREMLHAPAVAGSAKASDASLHQAAMRIVVVGQALASRLQRWGERQSGGLAPLGRGGAAGRRQQQHTGQRRDATRLCSSGIHQRPPELRVAVASPSSPAAQSAGSSNMAPRRSSPRAISR